MSESFLSYEFITSAYWLSLVATLIMGVCCIYTLYRFHKAVKSEVFKVSDVCDTAKVNLHLVGALVETTSNYTGSLEKQCEELKAELSDVTVKWKKCQFDIDFLERQSAKLVGLTSEVVKQANIEAQKDTGFDPEIFTAAIEALGKPVNQYEAGVYNGIVALANVMVPDNDYKAVDPKLFKTVVTQKRNAKGHFIKG